MKLNHLLLAAAVTGLMAGAQSVLSAAEDGAGGAAATVDVGSISRSGLAKCMG